MGRQARALRALVEDNALFVRCSLHMNKAFRSGFLQAYREQRTSLVDSGICQGENIAVTATLRLTIQICGESSPNRICQMYVMHSTGAPRMATTFTILATMGTL